MIGTVQKVVARSRYDVLTVGIISALIGIIFLTAGLYFTMGRGDPLYGFSLTGVGALILLFASTSFLVALRS